MYIYKKVKFEELKEGDRFTWQYAYRPQFSISSFGAGIFSSKIKIDHENDLDDLRKYYKIHSLKDYIKEVLNE